MTKLTLVGGPTTLIEYAGAKFLTDPTFDDAENEYNLGSVKLTKNTPPALKAEAIGQIDAVLLSHDQHSDNLDNAGRELLPSAAKVYTTVSGAGRLGGNAEGLEPWQSFDMISETGKKIKITATPCRHGPPLIEKIAGDVIGFVLQSDGEPTVYITGDTVYYKGVSDVADRFEIDLMLAFAGAARTRGPFELTMTVSDLLESAQTFAGAQIMPVHFEGWEHFTQGIDDITQAFAAFGLSDRLFIVEKGEIREFI
ncbi:MAG: MBL fold metallo-hydrolase [Deferribacterales bacterium]